MGPQRDRNCLSSVTSVKAGVVRDVGSGVKLPEFESSVCYFET